MHITRLVRFVFCSCLLACCSLAAAEVYTWKGKNGSNSYSDVPRGLQMSNSGTINIRTRTVAPPPPQPAASESGSLADRQKQLSDELAQENKKVEEQNKKIEEQNRQQKEDNCKTARMNRQFAETARMNRDALIKRYEEDVSRYCQ